MSHDFCSAVFKQYPGLEPLFLGMENGTPNSGPILKWLMVKPKGAPLRNGVSLAIFLYEKLKDEVENRPGQRSDSWWRHKAGSGYNPGAHSKYYKH